MKELAGCLNAWTARSRVSVFAAIGLLMAGCVAETGASQIRPAKGVSAGQAVESFVILGATAVFTAQNCGAFGIRKNFVSQDQLIREYFGALQREGYSLQDLEEAVNRLSEEAVTAKAIARLKAQGVRDGDLGSLCRYAQKEIAAGTSLGKLLRT